MGQYCKKDFPFLEQCIAKAIWLYWFSAHFHYWWSCVFCVFCFLKNSDVLQVYYYCIYWKYFNNKPLCSCSKDFFLCFLLKKVPRILFWFRKKTNMQSFFYATFLLNEIFACTCKKKIKVQRKCSWKKNIDDCWGVPIFLGNYFLYYN